MQRLPFHPNTAMPSTLPADVRAAFTPTGALRASINLGNPILAGRNAAGEPVVVAGARIWL